MTRNKRAAEQDNRGKNMLVNVLSKSLVINNNPLVYYKCKLK